MDTLSDPNLTLEYIEEHGLELVHEGQTINFYKNNQGTLVASMRDEVHCGYCLYTFAADTDVELMDRAYTVANESTEDEHSNSPLCHAISDYHFTVTPHAICYWPEKREKCASVLRTLLEQ